MAVIYGNIGNAYGALKNFPKALECHNKSLELFQDGDYAGRGLAYDHLGNILKDLGSYDEAISNHQKARELLSKAGDFEGEGRVCMNLGDCYFHNNAFEQSEKLFRESTEIYDSLKKNLKEHTQWSITLFQEHSKAYKGLETALLMQKKKKEALKETEYRRAGALNQKLIQKLPLESISKVLTEVEIQDWAQKKNTTFIIYSLDLDREEKLRVWVVPPVGEIQCEPLPFHLIQKDVKEIKKIFTQPPFAGEEQTATSSLKGGDKDTEKLGLARKLSLKRKKDKQTSAHIEKHLPQDPMNQKDIENAEKSFFEREGGAATSSLGEENLKGIAKKFSLKRFKEDKLVP